MEARRKNIVDHSQNCCCSRRGNIEDCSFPLCTGWSRPTSNAANQEKCLQNALLWPWNAKLHVKHCQTSSFHHLEQRGQELCICFITPDMRGDHLWLGWHAVVQLRHQRPTMAPRSGGLHFRVTWWNGIWFGCLALLLCGFCGENVCRFQEKQKLLDMSGNVCCMILINMISPAMTALYSVLWCFMMILLCCVTLEKTGLSENACTIIWYTYLTWIYSNIYCVYLQIVADVGAWEGTSKARIDGII